MITPTLSLATSSAILMSSATMQDCPGTRTITVPTTVIETRIVKETRYRDEERERILDMLFEHNYATIENHFGKNVIVHRKGATKATKGLKGIIPGSQGTKSYIVEGLGNPESFMSCSHGAGRKMGRKAAHKALSLSDEQKKLDDQGILHAIRGVKDLDEAPGAYKDIETVMDNQRDLVKVLVELTPLAVIKG